MALRLTENEVRVLGALMEKDITTPEYYPLSLNALVNACNQKSNRDPVVNYDEAEVEQALDGLRGKGLATRITGRDVRVPKHSQRFTESFNLGRREAAVVCLLLLRGPQTVGELRTRSERLYPFDDLEAVEHTLTRLGEMGFVKRLPRQPGFKESRYTHLFSGDVEVSAEEGGAGAQAGAPAEAGPSLRDRVASLESEMAELKRQFEEFKSKFE